MNWKAIFTGSLRGIIALVVLILAIVASNIYEKRLLEDNQDSANSLYADRLQPSTYLFEIKQLLANKLFLLEHMDSSVRPQYYQSQLKEIDQHIAVLVEKYEATYMPPQEKESFESLKSQAALFRTESDKFVMGKDVSVEKLQMLAKRLDANLLKLNQMQGQIAHELLERYLKNVAMGSSLNTLQIILAIFVGMIVMLFFTKKKLVLTDMKTYRLN